MILTADSIETIRALVGCEVGNFEPIKKIAIESIDREKVLSMFEYEIKRLGFKWDFYAEEIAEIVIHTWVFMAQSQRQLAAQTPGQLRRYPAWRLKRSKVREIPRQDWYDRWVNAGEAVRWQGACASDFVALKTSPIWQALGDGAGGYRDVWGNPFPPFAVDSGMDWWRVSREECDVLGLV